jgi:hypothetical protein
VDGEKGLVYSDAAAHSGYQIVPAEIAAAIRVGDMIQVGTGHTTAPVNDPRPDIMPGANYGPGMKLVGQSYRRVTRISRPYEMIVDSVIDDDDHESFGGQRIIGETRVKVCSVHFERDPKMNW